MYGMTGGVEAVGRVAGARIMAGEGEPYFVRRDRTGRVERVIYPNASGKDKPQLEQRYDYAADGRLARVAVVDQTSSDQATYGPEKYVVEYAYDEMGRLRKKQVRNNPVNEDDIFFEGDYEYDGMGRLAIERIWQYDKTAKRLLITRETRTTYDLMGNPTEIKYYDVDGFAFTEQRTYARGGQLTGFSIPTTAANVTVDTAGSYSYNTNNDMTGTKKLDAYRTISGTNYKITFRAQWTFSFDRKNRLKTHTYAGGSNVRGNIWYDGMGRVWQRWNDNSVTGDWDADLKRFVYDGNALAQEHKFTAEIFGNGEQVWDYTYVELDRDYLRKPDGIRQKVNNGVGGYDSHFLFNDGADVASRTPSGSSTTITRTLRTASGDRLNDNPRMTPGLTTGSFNNISNLAKPNSYIESYGGGTELGTSSLGYDSLEQIGHTHYLAGLGRLINNDDNDPYTLSLPTWIIGAIYIGLASLLLLLFLKSFNRKFAGGGESGHGERCPDCCLEFFGVSREELWTSPSAFCAVCCANRAEVAGAVEQCQDEPDAPWYVPECRRNCCAEAVYNGPDADFYAAGFGLVKSYYLNIGWVKKLFDDLKELKPPKFTENQWVNFIWCLLMTRDIVGCAEKWLHTELSEELKKAIQNLLSQFQLPQLTGKESFCSEWTAGPGSKEYECCIAYFYVIGNFSLDNWSRFVRAHKCCTSCGEDLPEQQRIRVRQIDPDWQPGFGPGGAYPPGFLV